MLECLGADFAFVEFSLRGGPRELVGQLRWQLKGDLLIADVGAATLGREVAGLVCAVFGLVRPDELDVVG